MNPNTARSMRLPERAASLGYTWVPEMYPPMLHLAHASDKRLRDFFGEWPLPADLPSGTKPRATGI